MPQIDVHLVGKFLIKGSRIELDSLMISPNEASEWEGQTGVVFAELYSYCSYYAPQEFDLAAAEFVRWLDKAPGWEWAVDFLREQSVRQQQGSWIQVPIVDSKQEPKRFVHASVISRVPLIRSLDDHDSTKQK